MIAVIMSGGSGTRLWPLSRSKAPKQLQALFGDDSLLAHTARRIASHPGFKPPVIVCGEYYAETIAQQMAELNIPVSAILEEPSGRDTAAAGGIAASWVRDRFGEDELMALLPADHFIADLPGFQKALLRAGEAASQDYITTIGVLPTKPETGFGYIRRNEKPFFGSDMFGVSCFVEKPELATAKEYLASGDYLWNAGIFVVKCGLFLSELKAFAPEIASTVAAAYDTSSCVIEAGRERRRFEKDRFEDIPKNSIDYAIMEKTKRAAVLPAEFGWNDVGSWGSVREVGNPDASGNVASGDVRLLNVKNSIVRASNRLVAVVGLENVAVIDTPDAVLVCGTDAAQEIKGLHAELAREGNPTAFAHSADEPRVTIEDMQAWARSWLFDSALPLWARIGFNEKSGAAYDALDFEGRPVSQPLRIRVQARQVYVFSRAYEMGWAPGSDALLKPLHFLLKHGWNDTGGWAHLTDDTGQIIDASIDLYDHAFVLFGLAWAYKATDDPTVLEAAEITVDFLLDKLKHPAGGFIEGIPSRSARRANPHMHLFEAALAWMELHQSPKFARIADEIFDLFNQRFCVQGLLREHFTDDLRDVADASDPVLNSVEPGHFMEWAYLLDKYAMLRGKSALTVAVLDAFVDRFGLHPTTGLALDYCNPDGALPDNPTSRLWPQTEYIRRKLQTFRPSDTLNAIGMLTRLKDMYLNVNDDLPGLWHDQYDGDGRLISNKVPASTFYHIMSCFSDLIER